MLTLDQQFDNGIDNIDICAMGSFEKATAKIYVDHKNISGEIEEGVLAIPYRPYDEEYTFYYLRPFMEELKKYAE